jgi:hypothetical protein
VHHLSTIRQIISRWAPPVENDTEAYIAAVSKVVGIGKDTPADFTKPDLLARLAEAIFIQECGGWKFSESDLIAGIALAVAVPA